MAAGSAHYCRYFSQAADPCLEPNQENWGGWRQRRACRTSAAVRDAGELVEAEEGTQPPDVIALDPAILQLAKTFPEAVLVQAFKELEGVILQIRARLPDDKQHRTLNEVLKALAAKKYITDSVVALFQKVREARNTVAHARGEDEMSFGEAIELIRQIKLLQSLLMRVYSQLPPRSDRI